ncbi:MAG: T9SS type A sorting domain-containing protein [Bacteroidetes bacterium]|nr:T9SS type A sorting domain-containing protein [Bacteroidota bacterium]
MKYIYLTLLLFISQLVVAQRCETIVTVGAGSIINYGTESANGHSRDTIKDEVIIVPVVVHILYNNSTQNISDEQVNSQINILNADYRRLNSDTSNTPNVFKKVAADSRIVFCLAKVDPDGYKTTGIVRKYTKEPLFLADDQMKYSNKGGDNAWDATKYLNIWVCNLFGRTLGYAQMPGGNLLTDGVVIKYNTFGNIGAVSAPYNKGRTATHEIGHWLGLKHTWGDTDCGDDGIYDTPPQKAANTGCANFPHISSCSINEYGDMFMNFMDLSDDQCMNLFTIGQKQEMRGLFAKGNSKNSFLDNDLCDGSNAQAGPVYGGDGNKPDIQIYPNPIQNQFTIYSAKPNLLSGKIAKIYTITGKLILMETLKTQTNQIDLKIVSKGLYFLRIEGGDKPYIFKLIKTQ